MLNLPNALSLIRILIVPLLVAVLLTVEKFDGKEFVALGLFLIAAATDFLDGFLARRQQKVTRLGKLLDPAADKILMSSAFISLVALNLASAWMVVAIIAREFAVSALRSFAATENRVIAAGLSGKIKTIVHVIAISACIVYDRLGEFQHLSEWLMWAALLMSLISGLDYFIRYGRDVFRRDRSESS